MQRALPGQHPECSTAAAFCSAFHISAAAQPHLPNAVYNSALQGFTIALGLAACGAAAWGMISLNKHILPDLNARIDSMQELPAKVVQQVSGLADKTAALSTPLSNISSILSSMDCEGLRKDVQHVTAFLTEAPSPTTLKSTLQQLSSALKPELYEGLRQLQGHINLASPNSPLASLKKHVETLAAFDMSTMGPSIRSYSDSLSAVYELVTSTRYAGVQGAD